MPRNPLRTSRAPPAMHSEIGWTRSDERRLRPLAGAPVRSIVGIASHGPPAARVDDRRAGIARQARTGREAGTGADLRGAARRWLLRRMLVVPDVPVALPAR